MTTAPPRGAPPDAASEPIPAGAPAPDFTLHDGPNTTLALAGLRGRPVVLAFYPADWSPVCGDQMALYNEVREAFDAYGAQLLGVSVDSVWCHQAFTEARHLHFPLLADFEPKGAVSRAYGAYRAGDGFSERALFVLDAAGVVRWSYLSPVGENPGADGILEALDRLTPEQRGSAPAGDGANAAPGPAPHATSAAVPNGAPGRAEHANVPSDTLAAETTHPGRPTAETPA